MESKLEFSSLSSSLSKPILANLTQISCIETLEALVCGLVVEAEALVYGLVVEALVCGLVVEASLVCGLVVEALVCGLEGGGHKSSYIPGMCSEYVQHWLPHTPVQKNFVSFWCIKQFGAFGSDFITLMHQSVFQNLI